MISIFHHLVEIYKAPIPEEIATSVHGPKYTKKIILNICWIFCFVNSLLSVATIPNFSILANFFIAPIIIFYDFLRLRIPNACVLPWIVILFLGKIIFYLFESKYKTSLNILYYAPSLSYIVFFILMAELRHSVGYGDIKLFALLSVCLPQTFEVVTLFVAINSMLGICLLLTFKILKVRYKNNGCPFGPAIILGYYFSILMEQHVTLI